MRTRRTTRMTMAMATAVATALPLVAFHAAPAEAAGTQKYQHRAKVGAQILRVLVLDQTPGIEGGKVVDLRVGRASSMLNTRKPTPSISTSKSLGGRGLADNDLSGLLTALVAKAGPSKGTDKIPNQTLVPVPAEPLLSLGASSGEAMARWAGKRSCVPGGQDATSSMSSTTDATVLPGAIPGTGSLLALDGTASAIQSTQYLPRGDRAGLKGVATTGLADLELFGGAVGVEVSSDPKMVARATGRPGGAKIEYTPAVLEITGPDGQPVPIPTDGAPAEISFPENPLLGLTLQFPGVIKEKVTENGRMAKAKSVTLRAVLSLGGQVIADIAVAPLQTKVKVPKNGIAC